MSFSVASRMTIIWYGIIAYRQPEVSDTEIRLYLDFRISLENELKKREERMMAGLSSGFGKREAKRSTVLIRPALFILPKCFRIFPARGARSGG